MVIKYALYTMGIQAAAPPRLAQAGEAVPAFRCVPAVVCCTVAHHRRAAQYITDAKVGPAAATAAHQAIRQQYVL